MSDEEFEKLRYRISNLDLSEYTKDKLIFSLTDIEEEIYRYEEVIDKIKEYCKSKIEEQKSLPDYSKSYLENYDKAINTQHLSHSGVMLETVKSTTIKRCEEILEIIKGEIK